MGIGPWRRDSSGFIPSKNLMSYVQRMNNMFYLLVIARVPGKRFWSLSQSWQIAAKCHYNDGECTKEDSATSGAFCRYACILSGDKLTVSPHKHYITVNNISRLFMIFSSSLALCALCVSHIVAIEISEDTWSWRKGFRSAAWKLYRLPNVLIKISFSSNY